MLVPVFFAVLILVALANKDSMNYPPKVVPADWLGWVWPVPIVNSRIPTISDGFSASEGVRDGKKYRKHLGVDIMFPKREGDPKGKVKHDASVHFIAPKGTPIVAAGPGKVWDAGVDSYGHWVLIDHGMVSHNAGGVTTRYAHLERLERPWKRGDEVHAGTILGLMGYAPQNDGEQLRHLHFELKFPRSNIPQTLWSQNPAPYMRWWRKTILPENMV